MISELSEKAESHNDTPYATLSPWPKSIDNTPEVTLGNSAVFSIAMNGTEARLYISWKHDKLNFYTRRSIEESLVPEIVCGWKGIQGSLPLTRRETCLGEVVFVDSW
jgi:hypothetical protein